MLRPDQPPLWDYCTLEQLGSPLLRECHDYWASKFRNGKMPSRRDLDPVEFPHFMPNCIILDVEGPGLYRYRLFGTHVADWNELDLTGRLLDSDCLGASAAMFLDVYERVCREKAVIAFKGSLFWQDRSHQTFEQISLPLSQDGETVDKIFCAVVFD